jgi:histidinol phosphatase-like PHP family hydrolase
MTEKMNLHNHTEFSDGNFSADDIVNYAINAQLEAVGISDHFFTSKIFWDYSYEEWLRVNWGRYLQLLDNVTSWFSPKKIKILKGIEIDSCEERLQTKIENLPWKDINGRLDYVLVEYVGETHIGGMRLEDLIKIRELCQVPIILAHPDIDFLKIALPLDGVFDILRQHKIALEIPAGYRNKWFWNSNDPELLRGLTLSIGTDTHDDLAQAGDIYRTLEFLKRHNLSDQLIKF